MADENNSLNVFFKGDPTGLLNALNKVEGALKKLITDLEKSGASGDKTAKNMAASFTKVEKAVEGVKNICAKSVDQLAKMSEQAKKASSANDDLSKSLNKSNKSLSDQQVNFKKNTESLKGLDAATRSNLASNIKNEESFKLLGTQLRKLSGSSYEARLALVSMYKQSGDNLLLFKQNSEALINLEKSINKYKQSVVASSANTKQAQKEMDAWAKGIDRVKASHDVLQTGMTKVGDVVLSTSKSVPQLTKEISSLALKYKDLISSNTEYANKARLVVDQLQKGNITLKDAETVLGRYSKTWALSEKEMSLWNKTSQNVLSKTPELSNVVNTLNNHIKNNGISVKNATNVLNGYVERIKTAGQHTGVFSQFMSGLHSKLSGMASAANKATGYFGDLGHAIASMAAWIPAAMIISTLTQTLTDSIKSVLDFDLALKNLQAISGATDAEIAVLGDEILRLSSNTKYSADEIAKGAIYIAQAGFSAQEALQVISAAAIGAQGTLESLTTSADLLTTVIRAFQLDAKDANHIMDSLAVAANDSKTNLEGMRTVFNYIGPTAHAAGLSLNETLGAVMALSNAGIRMSTVGTSLRQVLIGLENPNKNLKTALQANGMTVEDLNTKSKGLEVVLRNLNVVIGGNLTNAVKDFNVRAGNSALVLSQMHEYVGILIRDTEQFGIAQQMADKQMESMTNRLTMLNNRFKNLLISFSEGGLTDIFKTLLSTVTSFVTLLDSGLNNALVKTLVTWSAMTVAVAGIGIAFGKLYVVIKDLTIISSISAYVQLLSEYFITMTARTTLLTSALATLKMILSDLWLLMKAHPVIAVASAIAGLIMLFNNLRESSERNSLEIQKNALVYADMSSKLGILSNRLKELSVSQEEGKETSRDYLRILLDIHKTYPELDDEIGKIDASTMSLSEKYTAQAKILEEAKVKTHELTVATVDQIIANAENADSQVKTIKLMTNIINGLPPLVKGTTEYTVKLLEWAGIIEPIKTGLAAQIELHHKMVNEAHAAAVGIASLTKEEQDARLKRLEGSAEFKAIVNSVVTLSNQMKGAMVSDNAEMAASGQIASRELSEEWQNYYAMQEVGSERANHVAVKMAEALQKANKAASDAAKQALKDKKNELDTKEAMELAYQTSLKESYDKEYNLAVKNFEKILELVDKNADDRIKAVKIGMDSEMMLLENANKQKLAILNSENLTNEEYLERKQAIEKEFAEKSMALTKKEADDEIAIIKNVFEKKKQFIDESSVYATKEGKANALLAAEKKQAEQLTEVYKRQLSDYKKLIDDKVKEVDKYKEASLSAEKAIEDARKTAKDKLEGIEEEKRKALQLTMTSREKFADDELEFNRLLEAGYKALAEAETASNQDAMNKKLENANKYFEKAHGMINDLVVENQMADGSIVKNAEETKTIRIGYLNKISDAIEKTEKSTISLNTKWGDLAKEGMKESLSQLENIKNASVEVQSLLNKQIKIQLDTTEALNQMEILAKQAGIPIKKVIEFFGTGSDEKPLVEKIQEIILKLNEIGTSLTGAEFIISFLGSLDGISKKMLSVVVEEIKLLLTTFKNEIALILPEMTVYFKGNTSGESTSFTSAIGEVKQAINSIVEILISKGYTFLINFFGNIGNGGSPFILVKTEVVSGLQEVIKIGNAITRFVVQFLGSDGTKEWWLPKFISEAWQNIQSFAAMVNATKPVLTVAIKYVTTGGGTSTSSSTPTMATGGTVPGKGEGDTVPALLTPGEYVIKKGVVNKLGTNFFNALNSGYLALEGKFRKFASGGFASEFPTMSSEFTNTLSNSFSTVSSEFGTRSVRGPETFASGGLVNTSLEKQAQAIGSWSQKINNLNTTIDVEFVGVDGGQSGGLSSILSNLSNKISRWSAGVSREQERINQISQLSQYAETSMVARLELMRLGANTLKSFGIPTMRLNKGGNVPGEGEGDSVPAMLTPGEFVIRKSVVGALGESFFNALNGMRNPLTPKFNLGGLVQSFSGGGSVRNQSEEVFTLNLTLGEKSLPLKVIGKPVTVRQQVKILEKELTKMRLSYAK